MMTICPRAISSKCAASMLVNPRIESKYHPARSGALVLVVAQGDDYGSIGSFGPPKGASTVIPTAPDLSVCLPVPGAGYTP